MAEQIKSNDVIGQDSVGSVHQTTLLERLVDKLPTARTFVAFLGLAITMGVCIAILFSENQHLSEYRSGAWAIIAGLAGACSTFFFGDGKNAD